MIDMDDESLFADAVSVDSGEQPTNPPLLEPWTVLIVDDDQQIHAVTRMVLSDFVFMDRSLRIISAYSGAEGQEILKRETDIAIILLDVVMETEQAGLDLVEFIRHDIGNKFVRIILRTGQPGQAPERRILIDYDINDYKEKSELTAQKLFSAMVTGLRSYQDLMMLNASRRGLEKIIVASASLFQMQSMEMFLSGILEQLTSLLGGAVDAVMVSARSERTIDAAPHIHDLQVVASAGRFSSLGGGLASAVLNLEIQNKITTVMAARQSVYRTDYSIVYFNSRRRRTSVVYLETARLLTENEHNLIQLFCTNAGIGLDNLG